MNDTIVSDSEMLVNLGVIVFRGGGYRKMGGLLLAVIYLIETFYNKVRGLFWPKKSFYLCIAKRNKRVLNGDANSFFDMVEQGLRHVMDVAD